MSDFILMIHIKTNAHRAQGFQHILLPWLLFIFLISYPFHSITAQQQLKIYQNQFQFHNQSEFDFINLFLFKISDEEKPEQITGFLENQSNPFFLESHLSFPLQHIQSLDRLKSDSIWNGMLKEVVPPTQQGLKNQGAIYQEIDALQKKASLALEKRNQQYMVHASFDLNQWPKALRLLSQVKGEKNQLHWDFARLHLLTANFFSSLPTPSPYLTASAQALKQINDETYTELLTKQEDELSLALIAYASRFIDRDAPLHILLDQIKAPIPMASEQAVDSHSKKPEWQDEHPYYQLLPSKEASIRKLIELKGNQAIPLLLKHPHWAIDRGFESSLLLYDFAISDGDLPTQSILNDLSLHQQAYELNILHMLKEQALTSIQPWIDEFLQNQYLQGSISREELQEKERGLAVKIAIAFKYKKLILPLSDLSQKLCVVLDRQGQQNLKKTQLLAAQAYFALAAESCHASGYSMASFQDFLNQRAMLSLEDKDFNLSHYFFKASWRLHRDTNALLMAVELLSQLSLIYASQSKHEEGKYYFAEAQKLSTRLDEAGERFTLAQKQYPKADIKAKLALLLMIFIIGFFAISRIIKLIYQR